MGADADSEPFTINESDFDEDHSRAGRSVIYGKLTRDEISEKAMQDVP